MINVLMCRPTYFDVIYDINPWMSEHLKNVDKKKALDQWNELCDVISRVAVVNLLPSVDKLPDLVFTANGGFIHGKTAILSKFFKKQRRPEEQHFRNWFENKGYNIVQPTKYYEGEGDHLVDELGRHWIGSGFRTDPAVSKELEQILCAEVHTLELTNPRWYHLDTCFCPLNFRQLIWYPGAFSNASQKLIRNFFDGTIEVSERDARLFCCNCIYFDQTVFLPTNLKASTALRSEGYIVYEFDLSEFIKSGGAAKCLVLNCGNFR
jgi:N-dimethylarginine dimethylaminohydrolase